MYAATGDERFKSRADLLVAELALIQQALVKRGSAGYLSAFPEEFIGRVERGRCRNGEGGIGPRARSSTFGKSSGNRGRIDE